MEDKRQKKEGESPEYKSLERTGGEARGDWLDDVFGLCADCLEVCDAIDRVVAERPMQMPREVRFPWDEKE